MTVYQGEVRCPHFPSLLYKLIEHSASHYVRGVISVQIDFHGGAAIQESL